MTRVLDLDTLTLTKGGHTPDDPEAPGPDDLCVMEAVAYIAGEPWSDHPACTSPVLTDFCINLNDEWPAEQRQKLAPFIPRLIGTRDDGLDETRGYLALDWLIRTCTPAWLDLAGLNAEARALRDLRRIVDLAAAQAAGPIVRDAHSKAVAAWVAAGVAAWVAAWVAARVAAWVAAGDAAGDAAWVAAGVAAWAAAWVAAGVAAWVAAGDAAGDAAWVAAGVAAWAALAPTVTTLQASALDLLDRMIDGRWNT